LTRTQFSKSTRRGFTMYCPLPNGIHILYNPLDPDTGFAQDCWIMRIMHVELAIFIVIRICLTRGFLGSAFIHLTFSISAARRQVMLESASIASGVTVAVLLVFIICTTFYVRSKRQRKLMSNGTDVSWVYTFMWTGMWTSSYVHSHCIYETYEILKNHAITTKYELFISHGLEQWRAQLFPIDAISSCFWRCEINRLR